MQGGSETVEENEWCKHICRETSCDARESKRKLKRIHEGKRAPVAAEMEKRKSMKKRKSISSGRLEEKVEQLLKEYVEQHRKHQSNACSTQKQQSRNGNHRRRRKNKSMVVRT